jgi:hypothetical protein
LLFATAPRVRAQIGAFFGALKSLCGLKLDFCCGFHLLVGSCAKI